MKIAIWAPSEGFMEILKEDFPPYVQRQFKGDCVLVEKDAEIIGIMPNTNFEESIRSFLAANPNAQITEVGCYVPLTRYELSWLDAIAKDYGGKVKGVCTFRHF